MAYINIKEGDMARFVVLFPNSLILKYIAKAYLYDYKQLNDCAYTGYFNDKKITIMSYQEGISQMGIYAYELFNFYAVDKIIKIGFCKSYHEEIKKNDLILAEKAYTLSNFAYQYNGSNLNIVKSSVFLNQKIIYEASKKDLELKIGVVNTNDLPYRLYDDSGIKENYCLAEAKDCFPLFYMGKMFNKETSSILVVKDNLTEENDISLDEDIFNEVVDLVFSSL